jgi:hypothetical protein
VREGSRTVCWKLCRSLLPSEIKEEEQEAKLKKKIKTFCAEKAHF